MNPLARLAVLALLSAAGAGMAAPTKEHGTDVAATIDSLHGDHVPFRAAFDALQRAVAAHDAAAVAALVRFPIEVNLGRAPVTNASPGQFIAQYDRIVTPAIAAVVARQSWDALFVNAQGVMLGDGEVWLGGECADKDCTSMRVRVITIQGGAHLTPQ